jgi:hypothetical protein
MDPLELLKFVQGSARTEAEQLNALAAMADAPGEDFVGRIKLPVQNKLPAFKLGKGDLGSILAGQDHGVAAPVIGQETSGEPTIGQLLIGE